MPTDRVDTSALEMFDAGGTDTVERYAVQTDRITQLDMADLPSAHSRIVAADALHVAPVPVAVPADAVDRRILMSEHISLLRHFA